MSNVRSAARTNLFLAPTGLILSIISSVLITRWLGPDTYADYATLTSILAWMVSLAESGCNIGLGRYLQEAAPFNAQGTLYRTLQIRRWGVVAVFSLLSSFVGPLWAASSGLAVTAWSAGTFLLVGLLCGLTLHIQLANYALMTVFLHRRMLLLSQTMMIVRALTLGVLAGFIRKPLDLIIALIVLAFIEAFFMDRNAKKSLAGKYESLPENLATRAQLHGLVGLFDKMTTAIAGGPFLILVLTGTQSRATLAMLAVATDLPQKLLSVACLPFTNLITPIFNNSRHDPVQFTRQITRLGALSIISFSMACAAIMTVIDPGLTLLVGTAYKDAISLAEIWLIPLFFETTVRMVWGTALLTLDHKKWLMYYNMFFGVLSVLVLFFCYRMPTETILALLGSVRVFMSCLLLLKANREGLLPRESRPLGVPLVVFLACVLGLLAKALIDPSQILLRFVLGIGVFLFTLGLCFRFLPLIPPLVHEALCVMAGKLKPLVLFFIPTPQRTAYLDSSQ